jgi:hypothetical protein
MRAPLAMLGGAFILAAVTMVSCKDSSSPPPPPNYVGNWSGKSGIDSAITFTVTSEGVTQAHLAFRLTGNCTVTGFTNPTYTTPVVIANGTFSRSTSSAPLTHTLAGSFSSNTAASGTLSVAYSSGGCSASMNTNWTATKQ